MGGSGPEEWNDAGQEYDANITNDPDAADAVFAAAGATLVMVGVNVTSPTVLDEVSIERLAASDTPAARFATRILPFYLDFYQRRHARRVASMHDPLAAGILLDPTLVSGSLSAPVSVLRMETCWRAVAPRHPGLDVPGRPRTQVVTEVDGRRFVEGLVEAIVAPARTAGAVR
jgi:purine nucleosidase